MPRPPLALALLFLLLALDVVPFCSGLRAPFDMAGDMTSHPGSSHAPLLASRDEHDEPQSDVDPGEGGGMRRGGMALLFGRRIADNRDPRQVHKHHDDTASSEQAAALPRDAASQSQLAGQVAQLLQVASNCAGLAALAFLGMQVLRSVWRSVENARQRYHIRSKSDAFAKAAFDESPSPLPSPTLPVSSSSGVKTVATVEELQLEQEEIWRVVHNIYKGHADKIAALEGANDDVRRQCTTAVKEAEAALSLGMAKLSAKLDLLEEAVSAQGGGGGGVHGETLLEALRQDLRREMDTQAAALGELRKEVPTLLSQHDKVVVAKLHDFGQDVKRLILQAMPSRPAGAAAAAATNSPKPKKGKTARSDE